MSASPKAGEAVHSLKARSFCGSAAMNGVEAAMVNDIALMMSEFVDNWPRHKKVSTSLALIAKTLRAAIDPPKHEAGEEVWEARPSGSNFDICVRGEPDAKAAAVVATVFSGEAVARQIVQAHNTRTTPAKLDAPDNQEALAGEGVGGDLTLGTLVNEQAFLEGLYRFLHACWEGTGRSYEDGSASYDYHIWRDKTATRLRHIGAAIHERRTLPSNEALTGDDRNGVEGQPIPMLLFCPKCGVKHVDEPEGELSHAGGIHPVEPEDAKGWDNPPHRSHLCHNCGTIWRPADVPTNGVDRIATTGKADTLNLNEVPALSRTPSSPRADVADVERVARGDVIVFLKQEADYARHAQANATSDTDKLYRMGQKDGLLLAADAIERGALPRSTMTTRPAGVEEVGRIADDWLPTTESLSALPTRLLAYIHDLETKCDPTGDVQTIWSQREQIDGLTKRCRELEALTKPAALPKEGEEETSDSSGETNPHFAWNEQLVLAGRAIYEQTTGDKPKSAGIFQVQRQLAEHLALSSLPVSGEVAGAMSKCTGLESGPNGRGEMRVVAHFPVGEEGALFSLLNAALTPQQATEEGV